MPVNTPFRYKEPFVPTFPKESLPEAGKTPDRGLTYLKAVIETLGCKVDLGRKAPPICVKDREGKYQLRTLRSMENNFIGIRVVYEDDGREDMIYSSPAREVNLIADWILHKYNPDPQKVEFEYIQLLNARYIYEHGDLREEDFAKVFEIQRTMTLLRSTPRAHTNPVQGDTLRGAYYDGAHPFCNGVIIPKPVWAEEGDTKIHFCAQPYIPFLTTQAAMSCSGGPFFSAEKRHFTFEGEGERLFNYFNNTQLWAPYAITFPCRSNVWTLSNKAGI